MEKRHSFILSLLITLLIALNYTFFSYSPVEREIVLLTKIIDGDTVELEDGRKIRLLNINTPEKNRPYAEEATNFLKKYKNKQLELEITGLDKYKRNLGRLYDQDRYLNLELVNQGLAHPYLVEQSELARFKKAEKSAKKKDLGIWKKSEHYNCLKAEINKYEESVKLEVECEVNIKGWTLKDESTQSYVFPEISVTTFTLYSGKGQDTKNELYWNRGKAWNDDKDAIFIRDDKGLLSYYDSYGY